MKHRLKKKWAKSEIRGVADSICIKRRRRMRVGEEIGEEEKDE